MSVKDKEEMRDPWGSDKYFFPIDKILFSVEKRWILNPFYSINVYKFNIIFYFKK